MDGFIRIDYGRNKGLFGLGFGDTSCWTLSPSHSVSVSVILFMLMRRTGSRALLSHLSLTLSLSDNLISDCECERVTRTATLQTPSHAMLTRVSFQFPYFPCVPLPSPFPFQTHLITPSFIYQPSNKSLAICNTNKIFYTHTLVLLYIYIYTHIWYSNPQPALH